MRSSLNTSCLLPQFTGILAPAPAAYAVPIVTATVASLLSCSSSSLAPVVEYITSALAVYVAPALVVVYIAPAHTVFTPRHTGIGVLGASASTYAAPFATPTGGLNSLPTVVPVVIYILRWHQHCTLHPTFSGYMRRHHQYPCTCACHGVHRAGTSSVLRRASTSTGALRACVFSLCRTFCDCNRELNSLPVVPTVYTCTCGGVHRAGTSSLCCTCACHGVPRAGTSSVLRRASTSTGVLRACVFSICRTFCNCNREFHSLPVVPTVYICTCGGVLCAGTTMVCCTAPVLMYIALTGTREPSF